MNKDRISWLRKEIQIYESKELWDKLNPSQLEALHFYQGELKTLKRLENEKVSDNKLD